MTEQNYYLEIDSDPNNLITVEEFVNYFAIELKVKEDKMAGLLLSVTEATTNAIKHANKNDKNKKVVITAVKTNDQLIVTVKDEGNGFDPTAIPDPTAPENLMKDSGRGLYLMKYYMDDVNYNITPTGTERTLKLNY